MATTTIVNEGSWNTFHNNGPFPTRVVYQTKLADKNAMPDSFDRYNDATDEIRRIIATCKSNGWGFRGYGSSWSLSTVAHQKDAMHFNALLNISFSFLPTDLHSESKFSNSDLFLFQCGNTIKEVSHKLKDRGRSLPAGGASNGQTIAGALSTGVHGSAFQVGALQECVVGLHLIIGPNPSDVVFLERESAPALSDAFIKKIKARVIRDDAMFNAAVVGLGSFGFIMGVLIQAEKLFLLRRYTRKIKRTDALPLGETLDFANSGFKIQTELDPQGKGKTPYHYKLYLNPYNPSEDFVTEIIYKYPYTPDYPDPIPSVKTFIYDDLPELIGRIASSCNNIIPTMVKLMKGTIFPKLDQDTTGTFGEIFSDSTYQGKAFAWALGIDHSNTTRALNLFLNLINTRGPVPGAVGLRFVKASQATLAFTSFPITCVLEMDGVQWDAQGGMISMEDFQKELIKAFMDAGIKFTWHWGKNATWNYPGLINYMYGQKAVEWKKQRTKLLSPEMAKLFSNQFMDDTGLSQPEPPLSV